MSGCLCSSPAWSLATCADKSEKMNLLRAEASRRAGSSGILDEHLVNAGDEARSVGFEEFVLGKTCLLEDGFRRAELQCARVHGNGDGCSPGHRDDRVAAGLTRDGPAEAAERPQHPLRDDLGEASHAYRARALA